MPKLFNIGGYVAATVLIVLGVALNLIVVLLNVGMPVGGSLAKSLGMSPTSAAIESHSGFYHLVTAGDSAVFLADVIPVPMPRPLRALVSVGDLLMFIGVGVVIEEGMQRGRRRPAHRALRRCAGPMPWRAA